MILGIGCDLIEIHRVAKAVSRASFVERVYTELEAEYCQGRGKQGAASFAARFAAKEAFLKAIGTGLRGGSMKEIEVQSDSLGKPELVLYGYYKALAKEKGIKRIHLTLSHSTENAMAYVVLED